MQRGARGWSLLSRGCIVPKFRIGGWAHGNENTTDRGPTNISLLYVLHTGFNCTDRVCNIRMPISELAKAINRVSKFVAENVFNNVILNPTIFNNAKKKYFSPNWVIWSKKFFFAFQAILLIKHLEFFVNFN